MSKSSRPWSPETGLITNEVLSRSIKDAGSPIYSIAGPPKMVKGLQTMLNEACIDDDDIRTEDFQGY